MAKRFTDTGKWDQSWFRKLNPKLKCVWLFLCDRCDHAGVWEVDLETMSHFIGEDVSLDEIQLKFSDKIQTISGDKLIINAFIDFQYGELNPENRVHFSVISRLEKLGANKVLKSTLNGAKDKDKEKDKEKVKETKSQISQKIEQIYFAHYPLKKGKSGGIKKLLAEIKTDDDLVCLEIAIRTYAATIKDPQFTKHFSTFASEWRDWLDPQAGQVIGLKPTEKIQPGQPKRISYESAEQVAQRNREAEEAAKNSSGDPEVVRKALEQANFLRGKQ